MSSVRYAQDFNRNDLADLFDDNISCLVIRDYFSAASALKATHWIEAHTTPTPWGVGHRGEIETDMHYSLGIPRQAVIQGVFAVEDYHKKSEQFLPLLLTAFESVSTPFHRFLHQVAEDETKLPEIVPFHGIKGATGVVRYMKPSVIKSELPFCHVDSSWDHKLLSANLYLAVPNVGGQLWIWDLPAKERITKDHWFNLISKSAYRPNIQSTIHSMLPKPEIVNLTPGCLAIFDTSRPHAVAQPIAYPRITIQTFIEKTNTGYAIRS